jgi:hypothetical protein
VGTLPPEQAAELQGDLDALPKEIASGITLAQAKQAQSSWNVWVDFCESIHGDPGLSLYQDPILVLLIFARWWRDGRLAPNGRPVGPQTAEDAVRVVGQAFSALGARDPRLNEMGLIDF